MAAEILEGDLARSREPWIVFGDRVVDGQLVLLLQHQQRAAGELLRYRTDGEHRVRRDWRGILKVGDTVATREDDLTVLHDADRDADDVFVGDLATNDAVDLRRVDARRLLSSGE